MCTLFSILMLSACGGGGGNPPPTGNAPPKFTSPAAHRVDENFSGMVYTATAEDADGDSLSFSLSGGADQDKFTIVGTTGALSLITAADNEAPADADANGVYDVELTVTDGNDASATLTLAVTVTNVNDAPIFTSAAAATIAENNSADVDTATASDADGDTLTYSISGGADQTAFTINTTSGALSLNAAADYENPADAGANGVYNVELSVTDGNASATLTLALTVTDVYEARHDASLKSLTLSAGALDQVFGPDQTDLTATVGFLADSVQVTAVPENPAASVTVQSVAVSGTDNTSAPVALSAGAGNETDVAIEVTAEDGTTTKSYTVTVTRESLDDFAQRAYVKAANANAEAGDEFGHSVALSGDTLAVGAYGKTIKKVSATGNSAEDKTYARAGAVYVFTRVGRVWSSPFKLEAPNLGEEYQFGASVALSGDTLAVGARYEESGSSSNAGAVYVFTRTVDSTGTTWKRQDRVTASDATTNDNFGWSVALSGDTLAVGARHKSSKAGASNAGRAYVFTRTGGTWKEQANLEASNAGASDKFGYSVALSGDGDTLAVGAVNEDSNGTDETDHKASRDAGAVYVFTRTVDSTGTTWKQKYLKADKPGASDAFGTSVALSGDGDTLAVGASGNAGAVYVFTRKGEHWSSLAKLQASNADGGDQFGHSVALSGNTLAVGANTEGSNGTGVNDSTAQANESAGEAGAVYVFRRAGSAWTQAYYVKASNTEGSDYFGNSVALSGDTLAVGANLEDGNGTAQSNNAAGKAGAVYVFR